VQCENGKNKLLRLRNYAIDRKSEAEARPIDRKSAAMFIKTEADAEKTRMQAKTSYGEELRKHLNSIQVLENKVARKCEQQENEEPPQIPH